MFGDTMNMAARAESSCPPGCIQLTDMAYQLCAPHLPPAGIEVHCRGPVEVKGSTEPIIMHLVSSMEDNDDDDEASVSMSGSFALPGEPQDFLRMM